MSAIFKVGKDEAKHFASVWTYNGVTIVLSEAAIQFATDFANVSIKSFIDMCKAQVQTQQEIKDKKVIVDS